jgi:hypothetical protein
VELVENIHMEPTGDDYDFIHDAWVQLTHELNADHHHPYRDLNEILETTINRQDIRFP